jgi:sortase A
MKISAINARGVSSRRLIRLISSVMIVVGFAALGYVASVIVSARYFQETEAAKFTKAAKLETLSAVPKINGTPRIVADGDVVGMIEIDSVGVRAVIVQGDSSGTLRRAVGHVPETALPGEAGNVALAAHRDTLFRPLRKIKTGDLIDIRTETGVIQYRVRSTEIVPPSDVDVLESRGRNELTLITCYPFYYVGHAPDRFVVHAEESVPSRK